MDTFKFLNMRDLKLNYRFTKPFKCRLIGFLEAGETSFKLKDMQDPKCSIGVMMDYVEKIPAMRVPQPVQVFGELCYIQILDETNNLNSCKEFAPDTEKHEHHIFVLKAIAIQHLQPFLISPLENILTEIGMMNFDI